MHPVRSLALYEGLACFGVGLTATTADLLNLQVGLTLSDIALVNLVFWIVVIVMELPTGMLADGKSRIWSVRVGISLLALSCFAYAAVQGVGTALVGEIVMGAGLAFISGAEQAWIADALAKRGESDRLAHALGTQAMAAAVGVLSGGFAGAAIGTIDLRLAWIAAGLAISASAWVAWKKMDDAGEIDERATEFEALRLSWEALRKRRALLWSAAVTVAFGLVVAFNHYWQPLLAGEVGAARLGWVWALIQGGLVLGGWVVRRFGLPEGRGAHALVLALLLSGLGLAGAGVASGLPSMLAGFMIHEFGRGLFRPVLGAYTQRLVESRYRATFGSLQSLIGKSGFALTMVLVWFLADGRATTGETIVFIWTLCGCLLALAALALWFFRPKA